MPLDDPRRMPGRRAGMQPVGVQTGAAIDRSVMPEWMEQNEIRDRGWHAYMAGARTGDNSADPNMRTEPNPAPDNNEISRGKYSGLGQMTSYPDDDANISARRAGGGEVSADDEPPDLSGKYNTLLSPQEETAYQAWGQQQAPQRNGRNPAQDTYDYDMRGFWKAGNGTPSFADNGHAGDQFKKPNHPTFSTLSQYHGADGNQGGTWGGGQDGKPWTFTPSQTNLKNYPPQQLQRYFKEEEPDNTLVLPATPRRAAGGDVVAPSASSASELDPVFDEAGERFGVDPNLLRAQSGVESGGNRYAISPKGAAGLMQVMPDTYAGLRQQYPDLSPNPFHARSNIMAGAAYLRQMHDQFGPTGAVAAYNAGPGKYQDYLNGDAELPDETQKYVTKVSDAYAKRTQQQPASQPAPQPKTPDVRALIDTSRKMGASDDEIRAQMQKSPLLSDLWKKSDAAGIPRSDVFTHFGLSAPAPAAQKPPNAPIVRSGEPQPTQQTTGGRGAEADDLENGVTPPPAKRDMAVEAGVTDNVQASQGIPFSAPSAPTPTALPHGYVGQGQPYQGGMDFNLPGGERHFTPGQVMVPGQTTQAAYRAAAAQGLIGGIGQNIKGASEVYGAVAAGEARPVLSAMDTIDQGNAGPAMFKGLSDAQRAQATAYLRAPPETRQQMRAAMAAQVQGENQPGPVSAEGQRLIDTSQRDFPIDPSRQGFGTNVVRGAAGALPMMAGVAAGTAVGGPAGGIVAGAAAIGAQSFDSTRQDALSKGAAPEVADRAATESALANMGIMALPVGRVIQSMPAVGTGVLQAVQTMAKNGVEFGSFNALSQFVTNYVKKTAFDPDQKLMDGTGQSAAEGFVTGLLFGVPHAAAEASRSAGQTASDIFASGARGARASGSGEGFTAENEVGGPPPAAPPGPAAPPPAAPQAPQAPPEAGPQAPSAPAAPAAPPPAAPRPAAGPSPAETVLANIAAGKPATGGVEALQAMAQGQPAAAQPPSRTPTLDQMGQQAAQANAQAAQQPVPVAQPTPPPVQPAPAAAPPAEEPQPFEWATAKVGDRMPDGRGVIASKGMTRPEAQALSEQQNGTVWADGFGPDGKPRYGVVVPEREQVAEGVEVQRPTEDKPQQEPPATATQVNQAAAQAAEPTPAQSEAGNYKKGRTSIGGMPVTIETPQGAMRRGVGADGQPWEVQMPGHYGYFAKADGADGDKLDVTLGPLAHEAENHPVFVVDQIDPATGKFDEHKTFAGYPTAAAATVAYDASFSDGSGPARRGAVNAMSFPDFKEWATNGDTTKALSYQEPAAAPPRAPRAPSQVQRDEGVGYNEAVKRATAEGWEPTAARVKTASQKWAATKPGDPVGDQGAVLVQKDIATRREAEAIAKRVGGKAMQAPPFGNETFAVIRAGEAAATAPEPAAPKPAPQKPPGALAPVGDAGFPAVRAGEQLRSKSGRELSPVPNFTTDTNRTANIARSRLNTWLVTEARKEAAATRDTFVGNSLRGMDPKNLSQSDRDMASDILWGDETGPKPEHRVAAGTPPASVTLPNIGEVVPRDPNVMRKSAGDFMVRTPTGWMVGGEAELRRQVGDLASAAVESEPAPEARDDPNWVKGFAKPIADAFTRGGSDAANAEFKEIARLNHLTHAERIALSTHGQEAMRAAGWKGGKDEAPPSTEQGPASTKEPLPSTDAPEAAEPPPAEPKPEAAEGVSDGSQNKFFTQDRYEAAKARMRDRLNRLSAGFDPLFALDGLEMAGYHVERGLRKFADYAKAMIEDLGDKVIPHLDQFYTAVRKQHGFDTAGMDDDAVIAADLQRMAEVPTSESQEAENGSQQLDQPSAGPLAPVSTDEVQGTAGGRETESGAQGSGGADTPRDDGVGGRGLPEPRGVGDGAGALPVPAGGETGEGTVEPGSASVPGSADGQQSGASATGGDAKGRVAPRNRPAEGTPAGARGDDFAHTDADEIGVGGAKAKYRGNIAAIRLLRDLDAADRPATREEQAVLSKWVGWGALADAFTRSDGTAKAGWEKEVAELSSLLTPDEYQEAAASSRNAHYTSPEVVKGMWGALQHLGFNGGRLLEPSVGIGNFFGLMPKGLRSAIALHGVEKDTITSGLAKYLYPNAKIARMPFQQYLFPEGHFDAVIGNPPFGSEKLYDPQRRDLAKFSIHNYFFARSIDALKPGGVMSMVVTNRLMDGGRDEARQYISDRADLVGAIRLPNDAFKKNAGTEVTTDILFLRKRMEGETPSDVRWAGSKPYTDKSGKTVPLNEYFHTHPEMMLGEFGAYGSMRGPDEPALVARPGQDTSALLREAIARLPKDIASPMQAPVKPEGRAPGRDVSNVRVGSVFADGKHVMERLPDVMGEQRARPVEFANDKAAERVRGMIDIRDALTDVRLAQLDPNTTDRNLEVLRKKLNSAYDKFVSANGPVNIDANKRLFREDPSWPQVSALEDNFQKGISETVAAKTGEKPTQPSAKKAAIFTNRTQSPYQPPETASSAQDALAISLSERGRLDLDYMRQLYRKSDDAIISELGDLVYNDPQMGFTTRDEYLSGNVKLKLAQALEAQANDSGYGSNSGSGYQRNVDALQAIQPVDIEPVRISVKPGATWLPRQDMRDFASEVLGQGRAEVSFNPANAKWTVRGRSAESARTRFAVLNKDGIMRADVADVIEAAANQQPLVIYDSLPEGKRAVNVDDTKIAKIKIQAVTDAFEQWIWRDDGRRERLARLYNDTFNTNVKRQFDGSHLTLPGKVGDDVVSLRPTQMNGAWRIVSGQRTLLDHVVGSGKTFTLIAGAMELRRTGFAKKPMIAVPNHLVGQWAADFSRLYPNANVLAASKDDFKADRRKRLYARIATGDWDAVIVPHSSLIRVEVDPPFVGKFIGEQINDLEQSRLAVAGAEGKDSRNVKKIQEQIAKLQEKMKRLLDAPRKDDSLYWGELGVDALMVDEAHEFKNLAYSTSMGRVAGLGDQKGSQKAFDLFVKTRHVLESTGGRNVVFATGTPISNTMAEMFTMQRYLDYDNLKQQGMSHFDAWARQFGQVTHGWELSPAGTLKMNSRFSKFVNLPELMQRYMSFADVINRDDINESLKAEGKTLPVPKVEGGRPTPVINERSAQQAAYIGMPVKDADGDETDQYPEGTLIWRSENLPKGPPQKGDDNMLKIMSDARKAALDMRLIEPSAPDNPSSKVNTVVERIKAIYDQWHADKGTQLVFCDLSTPKNARGAEAERIRDLLKRADEGDDDAQEELDKMSPDDLAALDSKFSVYDDMRAKLIQSGIPPNEIAFIHDAKTDLQKEELFGKVRSGRIRVLLGSTSKMGAGMNVQTRLVALHHMDAPWRPSDLEQREGRIIRQGNMLRDRDPDNFEIKILRYATKDTLDARMWQVLESKANFIEQVRKGASGLREADDVSGEAANSAEMKAASSGNPLILEEMDLRRKVKDLDIERQGFVGEQYRIRSSVRNMESSAQGNDIRAEQTALDVDKVPETFGMTITGNAYDKRADAGAAIIKVAEAMSDRNRDGRETREIGSYGGFGVSLDKTGINFRVILQGEAHDYEPWNTWHVADVDPGGLSQRVTNLVNNLPEDIAHMRRDAERSRQEVGDLQKQIQSWSKEAQLTQLKARHAEVIDQLQAKKKKGSTAAVKTDVPDDTEPPPDDTEPPPNGNRMAGVDLGDAGEIGAPPVSGRDVEFPPASGGSALYSFPAMLFDPATWRRAFDGVSAIDLRRTMRLGESSQDGMSLARKTADEIHVLFSPTSRGTDAKGMEHIIRARASMLARASDQSAFALEKFAKAVDRLPEDQQLAITDRVERGLPQPSPELQTTMTALKAEQDKWLRQIQSIGRLQDIQNSDDYMGRIYSNYREWRDGQQPPDPLTGERRAVGAQMAKSPIRGRAGFLKQRTFDTLADAMQAGLIPVTTNPIKMQMLKLREMQRFYYGTRMADDIKASGIARWVPASQEFQAKAEGLVKLDDPFFQPKLMPDRFGIGANSVPMNMRIDPGAWYAPAPAANVFNNYVSRGPAGHSVIYDTLRRSGNMLNSAQLSLSGFHATFVTLDSMMSHVALGMQQAVRAATGRDLGTESRLGTLGKGLATMATAPVSPITTIRAGNALRRAWLDPVNATPQMRRLADMLNAGGGRINMDQFYRSNASGSFFKTLADIKNPLGAFREAWEMVKDTPLQSPFRIAGRMIDTINEPLMGQFVPRMKLGVFAGMARDYLDRFPDATPEEAADAMTKAWDSVENRMGQMTYDNIFWNKTQKDIAFLLTRSVGWNLGTIREIGGGAGPDTVRFVRDIGKAAKAKLTGAGPTDGPDFTARMAYPIAMTVVTALVGAIITYLLTGKGPQQTMDYFYPPTGSLDDGGEPNRLSIPGYIKDVIAYKKDPAGTILNKIQPLAEVGKEIYTNRDYYGGSIYDPKFDKSATSAYAEYLMNEALPFSIRAMIKNRNEGESMETQMLSFWGIQPAPQSIVHPEKEEKWQAGQDKRAYRTRLKEEGKGRLAPFSGE